MTILKEKVGLTNEDLRKLRSMRPGMPLDLQVVSPTATKRVRTEFIGMEGTRCLIIKFPDEGKWGNLRDAIYPDNSMVVRYILEDETGEIVAFKVKITLVLSKPGNYVFTTFPLSLQSHELRAETRSQTQVPVTLLEASTNTPLCKGTLMDLSNSGCRVGVNKKAQKVAIATKQKLKILIKLNDGSSKSLVGTVMNLRTDEVTNFFGVKFEESESAVEALLARLLIT